MYNPRFWLLSLKVGTNNKKIATMKMYESKFETIFYGMTYVLIGALIILLILL